MKAKRKIGKTIYKSKKKRKLDDVRVQQETRTRESGNKDEYKRERVSEAKVTNLKTGKPSYTKVIDERDSKGNYSLRQMQSTPGEGGTYGNVGKGEYISFDKDMNLSSGGKKIKNIDPITLGDMVEASANKFFKNGGKMKPKKGKKGFEGYKKVASSESSNAIMAKKASHHGKHPKAEYKFTKDKEGKMHMYAKYKKGGKVKGKTVTKEMVDKEFAHNFEVDANLTNKMAKQAATGLKPNGFPMKPANVKALREQVKKRKEKEGKAKPSYKYVGTKVPGGPTPRFKEGGKLPPKIKKMLKKAKAPKKGGVLDEVTVTAKAPTKTEKLAAKEFSKGLSSMKLGFPVTTVEQYYNLESVGNKARRKTIDAWGDISGAFNSVDKLKEDTRKRARRGQAFRYKYGGKMKKYLKGGQVKLDANKDGKITGDDFKMLRKK